MPLWLSSGDSTPATNAFITSPVNACSDDAEPRWRGYMSSTESVRLGNNSAMPTETIDIGSTANGTDGTGKHREERRKSGGTGEGVVGRVDTGGRGNIKQKKES